MMISFVRKHIARLNTRTVFLCVLTAAIAGCSKDHSDMVSSPHASVSIYAMVLGAPDLNVFLNGSNVATGLGYGSYTLYSSIVPGNVSMQVQSYSHDITADTGFTVAADRYYSVFLTDTTTAIKPIVLRDSFPSSDTAYCGLRFLVFSPGISGIDFHIFKNDSTLNQTGWANRSYGEKIALDSINTFKKYQPGTYSFFVVKANSKDTLARFASKTFSDTSNYTLLLEGRFAKGDTALQLGIRLH